MHEEILLRYSTEKLNRAKKYAREDRSLFFDSVHISVG